MRLARRRIVDVQGLHPVLDAAIMNLGLLRHAPRAAASAAEPSRRFGLSSHSKRLMQLCGVLVLTMLISIAGTIWHMRRTAISEASIEVTKLGVTISEQTARSVQAADLVLRALRSQVLASGAATPEDLNKFFEPMTTYQTLRRQTDELPQANAFTIVGADGKLVSYSRTWPVPPMDLSDRDYYRYFRDHDDAGMFVSEPVANRGNGRLTVYLARRVSGPAGQFLGLVLCALDLHYFQSFYKLISSNDMSVTLLRSDGTVLTGYPALPPGTYKMPAGTPWYESAGHGEGIYLSSGLLGRSGRLVSVHALVDYPIVVDVGIAYSQILAPWRGEALLIGTGTLCAIICVGLLLRALIRQLHRLEQSEAVLVTQNERLMLAQERMRMQAALLSANQAALTDKSEALETTLETMDQGLLTVTQEGRVAIYNRRLLELLDLPGEWLATKPHFAEVIAYQSSTGEFDVPGQVIPAFVSSGSLADQPYRYERMRPNGRSLEVHSIPLDGGGMVRTFTDITDRRRSEEQVRYFARHDSLTKLVNRVVFQERLQQAIALADRTGHSIAVLCLDLDRFKHVNDTRGHAVGDQLLADVSARLQSAVRDTDTVARMGGDEFAIVQPLVDQPNHAEQLASRLLELISRPYDIDGTPALIGLSVGISLYPAHGATAGVLLRRADTALYRAKADGRGVFRVFDQSMEEAQQDVFQVEHDLRQALDRNELEIAYQPIVDAATRGILCYEALLRWNHPLRGPVGPAEFIPLAEMSGSILAIGFWVLETACAEAATWSNGVRVSVNLSPLQFRQGELVALVKGVLTRTGLAPDRLSLEVTEGLLLDGTRQVLGMMEELRALGVRFSLDDFGTAHAGLSYLRCFSFDAIKIDKSFVQDAVTQPESRAIVKTILAMASVLKLNVIAEGVETEEQLTLLRQMRCRQVQGYLTGRPVPANVAREQIRTRERGVVHLFEAATA
jgi:diguanylate cyclase (GGDEF)-like protein